MLRYILRERDKYYNFELKTYSVKDKSNEIVKSTTITVYYETDRSKGSNDFSNLQDFKKWLDKNPLIAERLGYIKKK